MDSYFKIDPSKLNPKFDGYKLDPFNEASNLFRSVLIDQGNIQLAELSSDSRLGFRDLQARIRYSQLIYAHPLDHNRGAAFCIDLDYNLHMIVFDKASNKQLCEYIIILTHSTIVDQRNLIFPNYTAC